MSAQFKEALAILEVMVDALPICTGEAERKVTVVRAALELAARESEAWAVIETWSKRPSILDRASKGNGAAQVKQPYDPRTLRYCARMLRSESRERLARIEGSKCPNYWQGQADELIFRARDFEYEAGVIERSDKLPPKAEGQ